MKTSSPYVVWYLVIVGAVILFGDPARAEVDAWKDTITIPTYPWEEDVNPKFWALEGGPGLSTTVKGAITYPYTMQDHLSRTKVDWTYKALFLENEYLKVTCLPQLGGRLHSVLDKTDGKEVFHLNRVIKPGMIAMRGAWISGGVEWNSGPHGHTVTAVSPVDAIVGKNDDGSAFLEISNQEKIFRTRWTVRVTLRPGKAYLEEQIRIYNPTDGMHPYYFWNCTAFPNLPGTRFIYPMTLGTDHNFREFFDWPVHEGKDLSWLKNYEIYTSVFAVDCQHDFFGAYDVDLDRGIVQVADHHKLPGKKAWTWGNWDFGRVSQQNLTDEDGPYIEVQSGPLPTQSDYGMLAPSDEVGWREWWYPVHGLGDGFEYATKDVAVRTSRVDGNLELRILATGRFPEAVCRITSEGREILIQQTNLSPSQVQVVSVDEVGETPVAVVIGTDQAILASFTTPLPIPQITPPDPPQYMERPDEELTAEQKYLKGRKFDRSTDRLKARSYYESALTDDPGHLLSLRALAVLDVEAGLHEEAVARLETALDRDVEDGLSWYFLGVCHLRMGGLQEAIRCGYKAAKCSGTASLGYDLAGRARMRWGDPSEAFADFVKAKWHNVRNRRAEHHLLLAAHADRRAGGERPGSQALTAFRRTREGIDQSPTDLVFRALQALRGGNEMARFAYEARDFVGEYQFNMLETAIVFADVELLEEAARILVATCVQGIPPEQRNPLPLYYLAYYASLSGQEESARAYLAQAAGIDRDFVFPSRVETVEVLEYAADNNPDDANAHLHLGNLYANLGRVDEAALCWQKAAELRPSLGMAFRNLGLAAAQDNNLPEAEAAYQKAIAARPGDQTLHRDLAEILQAQDKRSEAIEVLEQMPFQGIKRADIVIMLAKAYLAEQRYDDCLGLLESRPYFVHWEGQDVTWTAFNKAHVARGRQRFEAGDLEAALADFEAALTYPKNLGVGRSNKPPEATAQYWRGKTLQALGRLEEARLAWEAGAAGAEGSETQNQHIQLCREAIEESDKEGADRAEQ